MSLDLQVTLLCHIVVTGMVQTTTSNVVKKNLIRYNSGDGNDTIYNYYSNSVIIYGGTGDDSITNYGSYSYGDSITINGGADNDYIYNYRGHCSSVNGDAGDDKFYNDWSKNLTNSPRLKAGDSAINNLCLKI